MCHTGANGPETLKETQVLHQVHRLRRETGGGTRLSVKRLVLFQHHEIDRCLGEEVCCHQSHISTTNYNDPEVVWYGVVSHLE